MRDRLVWMLPGSKARRNCLRRPRRVLVGVIRFEDVRSTWRQRLLQMAGQAVKVPPSCLRHAVKDDINVLRNSTGGWPKDGTGPFFFTRPDRPRICQVSPGCSPQRP